MISIRVPPVRRCRFGSSAAPVMFRSCASRADVPGTADPGGRAVRGRPTGSRPSRVATADRHRLHPSADCPLPGAGPRADGRRDRGARRRGRAVSRPGRATTLNTKQRTHTPPPRLRSVPTVRAGAAAARTRAPPHGATHAHARHAVARRATAAVTTPPRPHRALRDRTHVPAPGYRVRRRYCRLRPTLLQGTRTAPRAA